MAIKKGQIHVIGSPPLKFSGTPTFIDVEGIPDRSFYYLVGLRYEQDGEQVERSFWADTMDDERIIWENCIGTLKAIGNAQIVSYGAYELRFLRQMKDRYPLTPDDAAWLDQLIGTSVNLVASIYGKIYFPTFSNSLKEVGRYLGYEWSWQQASGTAALLLRRAWELDADDELKRELLRYNIEDCQAAAMVADALTRICNGGSSGFNAVDIATLKIGFQRTFGKFDSVLPEFEKINNAAYWDYQRSKVYVRTDKTIRQSARKPRGIRKNVAAEQEIVVSTAPEECSRCHGTKFWFRRRKSQLTYDLKFSQRGVKRWTVRYHYSSYCCSKCRCEVTAYSRVLSHGKNLQAFITYLLIELRLSHQKAADHASLLFKLPLKKHDVSRLKEFMAEKYAPTYQSILRQVASGPLVHVDETKGAVRGGGHYMWVFANMTTVAYVYAESRDSAVLEQILDGFTGVLVFDFYVAYDSIPCAQQKCLIHLMRDINEDLLKNPFNNELKNIAVLFGSVLRQIVETIDTHGLKKSYLSKHKRPALSFIEHVAAMKCLSEAGLALQKRIGKTKTNCSRSLIMMAFRGITIMPNMRSTLGRL